MKGFLLATLLSVAAQVLSAQVILRNDFSFNRKERKFENKGLTFITINLDNRPGWNQLINGRGGRTLVIDVDALRNRKSHISYHRLAERIYVPGSAGGMTYYHLPLYLTAPPPRKVPSQADQSRTDLQ